MTTQEFETKRQQIEKSLSRDLSWSTGIELHAEIDSRSGKIYMEKDGKELFGHKVHFYYRNSFGVSGRGEEHLEFNMGTMGNFKPSDSVAKMYIAVGFILSDDSLQDCIVNSIMYFRKLEKEFEAGKEADNE
jgi:hypothetical protein